MRTNYLMKWLFRTLLLFALPAPLAAQLFAVPATVEPVQVRPSPSARPEVDHLPGVHLVVSLYERRLWLRDNQIVLYEATIGVGRTEPLEFEGRTWEFATPVGRRTVLGKQANPVWVPPDWHYAERAKENGWSLLPLVGRRPVALGDGSRIEIRAARVVRVLADGRVEPLPIGEDIVFGDTLIVPPFGTLNRRLEGALGPYKLDLGEGYLIHGTMGETSLGRAATHGCLHVSDEDLAFLYDTVAVGTPIIIY